MSTTQLTEPEIDRITTAQHKLSEALEALPERPGLRRFRQDLIGLVYGLTDLVHDARRPAPLVPLNLDAEGLDAYRPVNPELRLFDPDEDCHRLEPVNICWLGGERLTCPSERELAHAWAAPGEGTHGRGEC